MPKICIKILEEKQNTTEVVHKRTAAVTWPLLNFSPLIWMSLYRSDYWIITDY